MDVFGPYQGKPSLLTSLCLDTIINSQVDLCRLAVPTELADLIARSFRLNALDKKLNTFDCAKIFNRFRRKYLPVSKIDFSGLPIDEIFLHSFISRYPDLEEINIADCPGLSKMNLYKLNELLKGDRDIHKTLIVGGTFSKSLGSSVEETILDDDLKLKKLVLHKVTPTPNDEFTINRKLSLFLTPSMSQSLRYLDLSMCHIGRGSALVQLHSLEILILYNCVMTYPDVISTICQLKNLHALDLSRQAIDTEEPISVTEDLNLLDLLVSKLPSLEQLDISGTNLVGCKDRYISAFESRMERPFEFLGLLHTSGDAAFRSCIPAVTVAGEANETQILNACEAYSDRPGQLSRALNELYNLYKTVTPSVTFEHVDRALDLVLPILTKHKNDEQVTIYTTAALWCIVKLYITPKNFNNDNQVRKTITSRLLDVMMYHQENRVILINGSLTLLFMPDIICEHKRVANISLRMCRDKDARTQGFGTTLLNTLACQVGGDQKVYIGNLKAIETMIDIIRTKIQEETCDEILEYAWSTLWNITDETPVNCKRFLDYQGLDAFEKCMDKFRQDSEVLRNIMGLLGNVAECKDLRVHFMRGSYINRFQQLLRCYDYDNIECSYNACGVLANLISEGREFWDNHIRQDSECLRGDVLMHMKMIIDKWPVTSRRYINYRSFEPIVKLLDTNIDAEAQYWAVFAITNLTRINPAKYCPMLVPFEGVDKLKKLTEPGATKSFVQKMAQTAMDQYRSFMDKSRRPRRFSGTEIFM